MTISRVGTLTAIMMAIVIGHASDVMAQQAAGSEEKPVSRDPAEEPTQESPGEGIVYEHAPAHLLPLDQDAQ